ncbi:hypothetical protein ACFLR5_01260 [Elusimicrobiota bacterium]
MNRFHYTEIGEPIKVGAVFDNSRIKPKWFIWNRKKYSISEITYNWVDKNRGIKHYFFSAWDGKDLYELSFNMKFLTWRLEKIYLE